MQSDLQADNHPWHLFGLDLGRVGRYLRAGWRELMWGDAAGIRKRADMPVVLQLSDGTTRFFVAEHPYSGEVPEQGPELVHALQLPAEKVLLRRLRLPQVLELELDVAVAREVRTHSPFASDNTVFGWRVVARAADMIEISLAIAARSDVLAWLATSGQSGTQTPEVWALDDSGSAIILQGFGEARRRQAYSRRIVAVALRLCFIFLCLVVLLALPGLVRTLQGARMATYLEAAQADAAEAQQLREELLAANTRVMEFQAMLKGSVNHAEVLERISRLTPDEVYLLSYELEGQRLRLVGQAVNGAAYMQLLADQGGFHDVQNPSGFRREQRTGLERFVLDMRLTAPAGESRP